MNKKEKQVADLIAEHLKEAFLEFGLNPDTILLEVFRQLYGHNVNRKKYIELIERSPLNRNV